MEKFDLIIIGAGIAGSSLAVALAKRGLNIALVDQSTPLLALPKEPDQRVSAINLASQLFFSELGIWEDMVSTLSSGLKKLASPYEKMFIWDKQGHLEFKSNTPSEPALGFILENSAMLFHLQEAIRQLSNITTYFNSKPLSLREDYDGNHLLMEPQKHLFAKLIVGADGAHSWVKKTLGLKTQSSSYKQTAIVAHVETEKPHQKTAYQRFLKTGPLAFLPLINPNHSSIVWSTADLEAESLLKLAPSVFSERLDEAFQHKLGKTHLINTPLAFPLVKRQTSSYKAHRTVLVGDAAHTIHPLAGLGLNLGLSDVSDLAELVAKTHQKKQDIGNEALLSQYQRKRRANNTPVILGMSFLKTFFSNDNEMLSWLRNQGLSFINQTPWIKKEIILKAEKI